jgi:hypothetical protein
MECSVYALVERTMGSIVNAVERLPRVKNGKPSGNINEKTTRSSGADKES